MRALLDPAGSAGDTPLDDAALTRIYTPSPGRHVRANLVVTADGAVETGGTSAGVGGPADKQLFSLLRSLPDAVLVGAGTARDEDYGPVRVRPDRAAARRAAGRADSPTLVVVSGRAQLDPAARLFTADPQAPRVVVATCEAAPQQARDRLAEVAEVVVCGQAAPDLAGLLDLLAARGLEQVLCEGGPVLLGGLLDAGLLDELCLTSAPLLAGGGHLGLAPGPARTPPIPLTLRSLLEQDGFLFARYAVAGAAGSPQGAQSGQIARLTQPEHHVS